MKVPPPSITITHSALQSWLKSQTIKRNAIYTHSHSTLEKRRGWINTMKVYLIENYKQLKRTIMVLSRDIFGLKRRKERKRKYCVRQFTLVSALHLHKLHNKHDRCDWVGRLFLLLRELPCTRNWLCENNSSSKQTKELWKLAETLIYFMITKMSCFVPQKYVKKG